MESTTPRLCPLCGSVVPEHDGAGRPRKYCSDTCSGIAAKSYKVRPFEQHDFQPAPNGIGSICVHCECAPRSPVGRLPKCPVR